MQEHFFFSPIKSNSPNLSCAIGKEFFHPLFNFIRFWFIFIHRFKLLSIETQKQKLFFLASKAKWRIPKIQMFFLFFWYIKPKIVIEAAKRKTENQKIARSEALRKSVCVLIELMKNLTLIMVKLRQCYLFGIKTTWKFLAWHGLLFK